MNEQPYLQGAFRRVCVDLLHLKFLLQLYKTGLFLWLPFMSSVRSGLSFVFTGRAALTLMLYLSVYFMCIHLPGQLRLCSFIHCRYYNTIEFEKMQ